jgi:hypothetical protein
MEKNSKGDDSYMRFSHDQRFLPPLFSREKEKIWFLVNS